MGPSNNETRHGASSGSRRSSKRKSTEEKRNDDNNNYYDGNNKEPPLLYTKDPHLPAKKQTLSARHVNTNATTIPKVQPSKQVGVPLLLLIKKEQFE